MRKNSAAWEFNLHAGVEPFGLVRVNAWVNGAGDELELARAVHIKPFRGAILRSLGRECNGRLAVPRRLGYPGHAIGG